MIHKEGDEIVPRLQTVGDDPLLESHGVSVGTGGKQWVGNLQQRRYPMVVGLGVSEHLQNVWATLDREIIFNERSRRKAAPTVFKSDMV